jgi:hypothetical protein
MIRTVHVFQCGRPNLYGITAIRPSENPVFSGILEHTS